MAKTVFDDGNQALGQKGTRVTAAQLNGLQNHRHDGKDQDGSCPLDYVAATGTGNAVAISLTPALTAHVAGMPIRFKASAANTGSATLAVNGLSAVGIRHQNGSVLLPGDLQAGGIYTVMYDGTYYQLEGNVSSNTSVSGISRNLLILNNATTPNSKVDISADEVVLVDSTGYPIRLTGVSVTADITVSGAGGLDTGAEANSTWYAIWLIYDGTTISPLLSTSSSAPTLPGGYTFKAHLGYVRNDSSGNFVVFMQRGSVATITEQVIFTALAGVTSYTSQTLSGAIPPNAKRALGNWGLTSGQSRSMAIAADSNGLGVQVFNPYSVGAPAGMNGFVGAADTYQVPIKTAQTIYWKATDTQAIYRFTVTGYEL